MTLPFPVFDIELLANDPASQHCWLENEQYVPKPGDLMYHAPNVMPAELRCWPNSSIEDHTIARSMSTCLGIRVPKDAVFTGMWVAHDGLGNPWCFASAAGVFGYVRHLVTPEVYQIERYKYGMS